jgi:hypothetical protein
MPLVQALAMDYVVLWRLGRLQARASIGWVSTPQHGRVFCTPDHRAQYLIMNPSRCDNCNGVIHASRLDTKAERFCSTSCAVEYHPVAA